MTLYNNNTARHRYTIGVKTFSVDPTREQIVPSPGYTWIPEPTWVVPQKRRVRIDGNESRALRVTTRIPDDPDYHGKSWEALLWIEPDEGPQRFARIQIETTQGPAE